MKKYVDIKKSARRNIFDYYGKMDFPYCGITTRVDVTQMVGYCKQKQISSFRAMMYMVSLAANNVKEFRYRLEGDKVVEYNVTHPSHTLITLEDAFNFCTVEFQEDFKRFDAEAAVCAKELEGNIDLFHEKEPDRQDLIFITCVPWLDFIELVQPYNLNPPDSIPRIGWGKYVDEGGRKKMSISIVTNHALADGLHIAKFVKKLNGYLEQPEKYLK